MSAAIIGMICIGVMLVLMALRCPIALAMAGAGFVGFSWIVAFQPGLEIVAAGPFGTLSNYAFGPIPLFILMGVFASKARMSSELFSVSQVLFGKWRGGMALAGIGACAAFAAISGSSLATAATMGRVALPEMRENGYSPSMAAGSIAAGGTLGIMIPPSIALLLYALITQQSVGDMFVAGILPGLLGFVLYCSAIAIRVILDPNAAPSSESTTWLAKIKSLKNTLPFGVVFATIIGGIYGGLFTATEGAAVGVAATLVIAVFRGMTRQDFVDAVNETLMVTAIVFFMIIGAEIFGYLLSVSRVSFMLVEMVEAMGLTPLATILVVIVLYMILGCVMDSLAMMLLTVPVVYPLVMAAGFDPVWFGIVTVVAVEMGLITPPVGMNVFVIKSVAPDIPLGQIFKGVLPFVASDIVRLALLIIFPWLALGLL